MIVDPLSVNVALLVIVADQSAVVFYLTDCGPVSSGCGQVSNSCSYISDLVAYIAQFSVGQEAFFDLHPRHLYFKLGPGCTSTLSASSTINKR